MRGAHPARRSAGSLRYPAWRPPLGSPPARSAAGPAGTVTRAAGEAARLPGDRAAHRAAARRGREPGRPRLRRRTQAAPSAALRPPPVAQGRVASASGSVPNQRSATPRVRDIHRRGRRLRLPLSQAGSRRAELAWGCKEGLGRPGPPWKPALPPNAPPGPADVARDVSREFTRLWLRESLPRGLRGAL